MLLRPTLYNKNIFKVSFNDVESLNLKNALNGEITISNPKLCYYIESELPRRFKECRNKGVTVTEIINGLTIIATVLVLDDIEFDFCKPKLSSLSFRFTKVSFDSISDFNKWMEDKDYMYKALRSQDNTYRVLLYNVSTLDEMDLSSFNGVIESKFDLRDTIGNFIKELKRMFNV